MHYKVRTDTSLADRNFSAPLKSHGTTVTYTAIVDLNIIIWCMSVVMILKLGAKSARGHLAMFEDIFSCHKEGVLLACSRQRPGILLNVRQC